MNKENILSKLSEIGTDEARLIKTMIIEDETYLTDSEKIEDLFNFILSQYSLLQSQKVNKYNEQVAKGIEGLRNENCWPNLHKIGQHAFEEIIKCIDKDKNFAITDAGKMIKHSSQLVIDFDELPYKEKVGLMEMYRKKKRMEGI